MGDGTEDFILLWQDLFSVNIFFMFVSSRELLEQVAEFEKAEFTSSNKKVIWRRPKSTPSQPACDTLELLRAFRGESANPQGKARNSEAGFKTSYFQAREDKAL